MNKAYNNFYLIKPFDEIDGIYKYENTLNVDIWRGNIPSKTATVVSTEFQDWFGSITGNSYSINDMVVYDPTCVIKNFEDGTKLVRDDAIICLFDSNKNEPRANKNEVVIKIDRTPGLDMQNIVNGFYGTIVDIKFSDFIDENDKIREIIPGNKVIFVNPYKSGTESANDAFKKVSTIDGFYIIGEVEGIACKIEENNEI